MTGKDVEQCEKYLTWNGHGFNIDDDARLAQLGPFQQLVLMLIKETPRCLQKSIVDRTGKDQSQVSKAIDKLVEVGLVVKNWHSHLICLLPKSGELGWLQLIAIEREQFYEIVSNSSGGDANSFFGEDISD